MKVFVIDDDESVQRALGRLLCSAGFQVQTFGSAQRFLESDCPNEQGCLVLDVRMPGMSGLDLQKRLAERDLNTPIVFITAHDDDSTRDEALRAGAVAFIIKPFDDQELLDAVYSGLEQVP